MHGLSNLKLNWSPMTLIKHRGAPCLCWSQRVATHLELRLTMLVRLPHWTWTFRLWLEQIVNTHSMQRACPQLQFQMWSRISQLRYQNSTLFTYMCLNSVSYLWRSVHRKRAGSANFANTKACRLPSPSCRRIAEYFSRPQTHQYALFIFLLIETEGSLITNTSHSTQE
jgi:hypothetical protein